jgi:hypothetical protein
MQRTGGIPHDVIVFVAEAVQQFNDIGAVHSSHS